MRELYRGAKKRVEKSRVLDQVCVTLKRCRRSAKRLMRTPLVEKPLRQREPIYSERLIRVLEAVWEAAQHAWSVRLKALLPLWMPRIRDRFGLTPAEQRLLLKMSPATMDRRLAARRRQLGRRIYGQTKPGRWLRQTIPIQTESSNVQEPGWMESDTVSHSGPNAAGRFAYTLDHTDLFSGWTELTAMLGKTAVEVVAKTDEVRKGLPFALKGIDSDNGEEFINYDLAHYCRRTSVKRFRSRPYKKDDQAHVEQKNGTHVRRLIGWHRYDTQEAVDAMNDLYRNEWRLLSNLFLPSVKLDYKTRRGSKIKRVYHEAKTPLDRLLESEHGDRAKLEDLRRLRERLDPFELSKVVDRKLQTIWKLASQGGPIKPAPTTHVPAEILPWECWLVTEDAKLAQLPFHDRDLRQITRSYWRDAFFGTN
jgi:hypothetical protein